MTTRIRGATEEEGKAADWIAEWQQLDGQWERITGPGPLRSIIRAVREWRAAQRFPSPETRVTRGTDE